jgi:hypothetical protein
MDKLCVASGNSNDGANYYDGVAPTIGDDIYTNGFDMVQNNNLVAASIQSIACPSINYCLPFMSIPLMISNISPSGVASDSAGSATAYRVFDRNTVTQNPYGAGTWVKYQFTSAKIIRRYYCLFNATYRAVNWTFEGSNDDAIWTTIHTVVGNTLASYDSGVFANSTAYLYYRISIATVNTNTYFYSFEMTESTATYIVNNTGGTWTINTSRDLNLSGAGIRAQGVSLLKITAAAPENINIISNYYNTLGVSYAGTTTFSGSATVNWIGDNNTAAATAHYAYGIHHTGTGILNYTGNITAQVGGTYTGPVVYYLNNALGVLNIIGNVSSNTASNTYAITVTTGTVYHNGSIIGGSNSAVLHNGSNYYLTGTATAGAAVAISGTGTVILSGTATNVLGVQAIITSKLYVLGSSDMTVTVQKNTGGDSILSSNNNDLYQPLEADVRNGTTYGLVNQFTGGLVVPNPNTVLLGVPTDNTTGTLLMTPADFWTYGTRTLTSGGGITAAEVWDYLITSPIVPDSILELILTNLDAKVSSITSLTASDMVAILQNYDSAKQVPTNNKISDSEKNIINEIKKISTTTTVEKKRPYTW